MEKSKELELLKKVEELRHKNRMEEIELEAKTRKEIENLKFDYQMKLQTFRSEEIRKTMEGKSGYRG